MIYRFGEYELDRGAFELRRLGTPVPIEPQVFGVLACLLEAEGRLVSKEELLEKVWGDAFVSEATLSSRIMAARKAIGDSGSEQRWIKTVHGRGFRFVGEVRLEEGGSPGPLGVARRGLDEASQALGRGDVGAAERALAAASRALESLRGDTVDHEWAEWNARRAQCLVLREGWGSERAKEHYEEAIRLAEGIGAVDAFRAARYHLATLFELQGEFASSEALMRAAVVEPAHENGDPEALELLACSLFHQGRFAESAVQARRGIDTTTEPGCWRLSAYYGEDPQVSCLYWLALSSWFVGNEEEAASLAARALRLSEQPGRIFCLAHSRQQSAIFHQVRRDVPLCAHWAAATVAIGVRQNIAYREAAGRILQGWAQAQSGEAASALPAMKENLRRIESVCAYMEAPYFATLIAECEILGGDAPAAAARLDALLDSNAVRRGFFYTSEILRMRALAEMQLSGASGGALGFLEEAIQVAESQGALALVDRCRTDLDSLAG